MSGIIGLHLKNFNLLKQDLNIFDSTTNGNNISNAINKYTHTIRLIFDSLIEYFTKRNFKNQEFLFLMYMCIPGSFPMKGYFTDFELSRIFISQMGKLSISNVKQQLLIIGGFFIVRLLLIRIIFAYYRNQIKQRGHTLDSL